MTYGTFQVAPALSWPMKEPGAFLDHYYDAANSTSGARTLSAGNDLGTDTISSVALTISPSGPGELTASTLTVSGGVVAFWLGAGIAGRNYVVTIDAVCTSGRTFGWVAGVVVDPLTATYPLPSPQSTGPCTALTWSLAEGLDFSQSSNSSYTFL
jgi:hypothetical protein